MNKTMNKKIIIGLLGIVFLYGAWYFISPFFTGKVIVEDAPRADVDVISTQEPKHELTTTKVTAEPEKIVSIQEETKTAPLSVVSYPVMGTAGHPASGNVKIIETGGKQYIRYENFKTINGPDLLVYLAKDLKAKEFISLGKLKATEGNINYEIPQATNIREYPYVLVWCEDFSVLFNYAHVSN